MPAAAKAVGGSPNGVEQIHFQLAGPAVVASAVGAAVDAAAAVGVAVVGPAAAAGVGAGVGAADVAADAVGGSLIRPGPLIAQTPALAHWSLAPLAPVQ